ncbi:MAG: amidohydrolase family protein [Deltaproteobacteria bacterium]|nr:MAG: amidohydrolase family protein [Deltaproteobacteria bacterium]
MYRREFFSYCLRAGLGLGFSGLFSLAYSSEALRTTKARATDRRRMVSTRIDTHGHTVSGLTADRVISLMDMSGISHMVLMARGRKNDALTTEIYKKHPQRILPFVSTMYPGWHRQDFRVLNRAERLLGTGIYKGVGEVMLRYYGIPSKNEPEINVPADSPFIRKLSDIVVRHNAVIIVLMEPEPEAIRSLENLLNYNKDLKLIWAHSGTVAKVQLYSIGHADIGELMDRHPNLYTDIAGVQPKSVAPSGGLRRPSITDDDGILLPRFKELLERHSDRVLFGLDTPWMQCWAEEPFKRWVEWADKVVAQLEDAGAAERIMYKNAARLFNI